MSGNVFNYFSYGSNLLRPRLLVSGCNSVVFDRIARVDNYKLAFGYKSDLWAGAVATIEYSPDDHVWGAVWKVDISQLPLLDAQEGTNKGIYERISVTAMDVSNQPIRCESYKLLHPASDAESKPSAHYLDVILRGAVQCGLPHDYIERLQKIEHNGYKQHLSIMDKINAMGSQN